MTRSPLAGRQPKTPFSKYLRERGISSKDLAKRLGFSAKAVDMWRAGYRRPGPGALQLLVLRLRISMKKLLHLFNPKEIQNAKETE